MRVRFGVNIFFMMAVRHSAAFIRSVGAARAHAGSTCKMSSMTATPTTTKQLKETSTSYKELVEKLQQISNLKHSQALLNYDQLVFMPQSERASTARGAQLAAMASIIHEKATAPAIKELISAAESDLEKMEGGDGGECSANYNKSDERILLELAREEYEKSERIPEELEAKRAKLSSSAYSAWVKARAANDFASFEPVLSDCFETAKETAKAIRGDDETVKSLYTVMLDEFERGMATERIDAIFDEIETALVPLLTRVLSSDEKPSTACLDGTFDVDTQKRAQPEDRQSNGFRRRTWSD